MAIAWWVDTHSSLSCSMNSTWRNMHSSWPKLCWSSWEPLLFWAASLAFYHGSKMKQTVSKLSSEWKLIHEQKKSWNNNTTPRDCNVHNLVSLPGIYLSIMPSWFQTKWWLTFLRDTNGEDPTIRFLSMTSCYLLWSLEEPPCHLLTVQLSLVHSNSLNKYSNTICSGR